jgi:hypothetical protein
VVQVVQFRLGIKNVLGREQHLPYGWPVEFMDKI